MRDEKRRRGITLPELMVVIAMVGILVSIASTYFYGWVQKNRQREATYELASIIRHARAKALELGNRIAIKVSIGGEVDLDSDGKDEDYILFVDANKDSNFTAGETVIHDKKWGKGAHIDTCITTCSAHDVIVYRPSGLLHCGNTTIAIGKYQIKISMGTGRVAVN